MIKEPNRCPHCKRIIDNREVALFDGMYQALVRVYKWCKEKGVHEFNRKEIEHLLLGGSEKARFGDWILFGGLVYKLKKGRYGLNMERCDGFIFRGDKIPTRVWKDAITDEVVERVDYRTAREIPKLTEFLNSEGMFEPKYSSPEQLRL